MSTNVEAPAGSVEILEEVFASPSREHVVETRAIERRADARWQDALRARLALAERIADRVSFHGEVDPDDVVAYRSLHAEQVAARNDRRLAAAELERSLRAAR